MHDIKVAIMYTMYVTILCLTLARAKVATTPSAQSDLFTNLTMEYNNTTWTRTAEEPTCIVQNLDLDDVDFIENDYMIVKSLSKTIHVTQSNKVVLDNSSQVCFNRSDALKARIFETCKKFEFDADEYEMLENGSVICYGDVHEPGMFLILAGDVLKVCAEPEEGVPPDEESDGIGRVGCILSVIALVIHLSIFCIVPSLRNVPGCNLAALSVAFLMGCTFYLVGQIHEVTGRYCVASAILQMYFLLASFFCLNTMAVDVWRTFRLSTRHLVAYSDEDKKRRLAFYMAYAWGAPLLFTTSAVIAEHASGVPAWIKPMFGARNRCWVGNPQALWAFFAAPACAIIVANGALFVASAVIIRGNAFKDAKLDLMLFARLACMMGVTWLVSVVALASGSRLIWKVSDVLNSLQGLILLFLFTCSKRVVRKVREKFGWTEGVSSSDSQTTKRSRESEAIQMSHAIDHRVYE